MLPTFQLKRSPLHATLVQEMNLAGPSQVKWRSVAATDYGLYAAGFSDSESQRTLVLSECLWNGQRWCAAPLSWPADNDPPAPILLAADPNGRQPLLVYLLNRPPVNSLTFRPAVQRGPTRRSRHARVDARAPCGRCANKGRGDLGPFRPAGRPDVAHVFERRGSHRLRMLAIEDEWVSWFEGHPPALPIALHVHTHDVYLGLGSRLMVVRLSGRTDFAVLPHHVLSLAGSLPHSRLRVVATMMEGAAMVWDSSTARMELFAGNLKSPVAGFTHSGWLAVADAEECQLYRTESGRTHLEAVLPGSGPSPLAVVACAPRPVRPGAIRRSNTNLPSLPPLSAASIRCLR